MDNSDNEDEVEQFDSSRMHQYSSSLFIDKLVSGAPPPADVRAKFLGANLDEMKRESDMYRPLVSVYSLSRSNLHSSVCGTNFREM